MPGSEVKVHDDLGHFLCLSLARVVIDGDVGSCQTKFLGTASTDPA